MHFSPFLKICLSSPWPEVQGGPEPTPIVGPQLSVLCVETIGENRPDFCFFPGGESFVRDLGVRAVEEEILS